MRLKEGFSLVELLVVISVVGMLSSIILIEQEADVKGLTNMRRDTWNVPYGLDDNEKENGENDCRYDTITSAGADGILYAEDDYSGSIPHILCTP